jgi:hypothetical protein
MALPKPGYVPFKLDLPERSRQFTLSPINNISKPAKEWTGLFFFGRLFLGLMAQSRLRRASRLLRLLKLRLCEHFGHHWTKIRRLQFDRYQMNIGPT